MPNKIKPSGLCAIALATVLMPLPAIAQAQYADPAAIDLAVSQFTGLPIGAEGGARQIVDRRLKLAQCRAPLALSWNGSSRSNVVVECPDRGSWRIFVPVREARQQQSQTATPVVSRGDGVSIAVSGPGFSVSQMGEAMDAGAVGEWVRVRVVGSRDILRARVERPGVVVLPVS